MGLEELRSVEKTVGAKQTMKGLERGTVSSVFLAVDSDERVIAPILALATEKGVAVERSYTMEELGKACHIKVKAAAVGIIR